MPKKNQPYKLTPTGRIKSYHLNYDVDRFSFVSGSSTLFEKIIDSVNSALDSFVGQRPFELNWEEIKSEYIKTGQDDVPHFVSQYVFSKFLMAKRAEEKQQMQNMYLKIVAVINTEIEKGVLPTKVKMK